MNRRAVAIVDLAYGDCGKGTMVDYLARKRDATLVVRFNGGPQAGHNVVLPDGRWHTFSQLGSATFIPGVRTLLSRYMAVEPYAMLREAAHLASIGVGDAMSRLVIDERAVVITPPNQVANRIIERSRGSAAHGTCGIGFGDCVADAISRPELVIVAGDLRDDGTIRRKLSAILDFKREQLRGLHEFAAADELRLLDDSEWISTAIDVYGEAARAASITSPVETINLLSRTSSIVYEGAQGVLLDEAFGEPPHTTWSRTTFANVDALVVESSAESPERVGVMRTYFSRHGTGPFTEFDRELSDALVEPHNLDTGWQGKFRRGPLDFEKLRYAIGCCGGIDGIALTHVDRLGVVAPHLAAKEFLRSVEAKIATPVVYWSDGPTHRDKTDCREA